LYQRSPTSSLIARFWQMCSAPVISEVSPKKPVMPSGSSLSYMLPTVGQEPRPVVVSLSPHLVDTQSSEIEHSSRCSSVAQWTKSLAFPAGGADRLEIAVLLDRELGHGLAGLADAVGDALGPARLDADHDDGGDVGVGAGADHGAEMQVEILAELQRP
jgi:hypothetical protein